MPPGRVHDFVQFAASILIQRFRDVRAEDVILHLDAAFVHRGRAFVGPSLPELAIQEVGEPQFLAEMADGMPLRQEVAVVADVAEHVEAQRLVADLEAAHQPLNVADDLVLHHQHRQRRRLIDARDAQVSEDVGARHRAASERDAGFQARLRVGELAVGEADVDVDGQPVVLAHLRHRDRHQRLLRPGEDELRRAHIKRVRDAAVADGHAGADKLRDAHTRQDFGVLLGQRARERAGRRRADLRHRPDGHGQVEARRLEEQVDAVEGELERADGFEEGVGERVLHRVCLAARDGGQRFQHVMRRRPVVEPEVDGFRGVLHLFDGDGDAAIAHGQFVRVCHRADEGDMRQRVAQPRGRGDVVQRDGAALRVGVVVHPEGLARHRVVVPRADAVPRLLCAVTTVERERFSR